jgi:hypothetical protein
MVCLHRADQPLAGAMPLMLHQSKTTPHAKPMGIAIPSCFNHWCSGERYASARPLEDDVATKKRVEQERRGKKNEIKALDSVNVWILLDSLS